MSPTRRDFIRMSCCTAGTMSIAMTLERYGLLNALAAQGPASGPYRALVCIFLFGGNDGNNLIVPFDNAGAPGFKFSDYLGIRGAQGASGGLGLTQAELAATAITAATPQPSGASAFALHPSLGQTRALFNSGRAAVVANVGTLFEPITRAQYIAKSKPVPANLFSHSDQQQQWQTSHPDGFGTTGWAGRAADKVHTLFNMGAQFPPITTLAGTAIICTGGTTSPFAMVPNSTPGLTGYTSPLTAIDNARLIALQELLTFDTGVSLVQPASNITGAALQQSAALSAALAGLPNPALATVFPATSIGQQLFQVAKIMKVRASLDAALSRQVFFCAMGGYDTHTNQVPDQQNLLAQLDAGMKAFFDATVELGIQNEVTTFTLSEFGRTLKPASGAGSDHGWGSHQIVVGGAVKGGDIYGKLPMFALGAGDDASSNGRWIPSTALDQFGATLAEWFGVPTVDLPAVFPNLSNFPASNLGFML